MCRPLVVWHLLGIMDKNRCGELVVMACGVMKLDVHKVVVVLASSLDYMC